jgi:hypothetical protein
MGEKELLRIGKDLDLAPGDIKVPGVGSQADEKASVVT